MLNRENLVYFVISIFLFGLELILLSVFKKDSRYEMLLVESFFLSYFLLTVFVLTRFVDLKIEYTGFAFLGLMLLKMILTVGFLSYLLDGAKNQKVTILLVLVAYFKYLIFSILITLKRLNVRNR